jgi:DNA-binding MurR/RpiR family transcriptional regulator
VPRQNLVTLLRGNIDRLSTSQRQMAEYVLRNYRDVAFMNVAQLATAAGVSPAAVVRFAVSLGFEGYPPFQRALHAIIRSELRQAERFTATLDDAGSTLSTRILSQELENLAALRAGIDRRALETAIRRVVAARRVAIVGFRAAATLAHYAWYNLRKVKADVALYTQPGSVTLDDLALAPAGTLVVLIAFPRYSRELIDTAEFARGVGFPLLGITNNELSPLTSVCPLCLLVEVGELSFTDFYAAPIALLNALVAEVARRSRARALGRLTQLDDLAAARGYLLGGRRTGEL